MIEKDKHRNEIINKLKGLNSIYGVAAREEITSEQEEELIKICYADADIPSFRTHLGRELFDDIVKYNVKYNNKPKIDL